MRRGRPSASGFHGSCSVRRSGTPSGRVSATVSAFSQLGVSRTSSNIKFLDTGDKWLPNAGPALAAGGWVEHEVCAPERRPLDGASGLRGREIDPRRDGVLVGRHLHGRGPYAVLDARGNGLMRLLRGGGPGTAAGELDFSR